MPEDETWKRSVDDRLDKINVNLEKLNNLIRGYVNDEGKSVPGLVQNQEANMTAIYGDIHTDKKGLLRQHEELRQHVDGEFGAVNKKLDGVVDDQKKWKWIAVGFSAAGTFFGSIIGWLVDKK